MTQKVFSARNHRRIALGERFLFLVLLIGLYHPCRPQGLEAPKAKIIPRIDTLFGEARIDNYHWLKDVSDSAVITYLQDENYYTNAMMGRTQELQALLYEEMKGRIQEVDTSVPVKIDDYYYYTRNETGKQYPIYCRRKDSLTTLEQILIDENELGQGHAYFSIGTYAVSPNHRLLAYTVDTTGNEYFTLYIKDLKADTMFRDQLDSIDHQIVWASDNNTIFYAVFDSTHRPHKLYRHFLGSPKQKDVMVYHEKDGKFWMDFEKTRSEKYVLINLGSKTTTEVRFLDAGKPAGRFKVISPRQSGIEYYVQDRPDTFYVLTNRQATNFKLMKTPIKRPEMKNWQSVIPYQDSIFIEDFDVFENHLILYERIKGLEKLHVIEFATHEDYYIQFSEPVYSLTREKNPNFESSVFRFAYSSLTTPFSVFDYNLRTKVRELRKQNAVKGYDQSNYVSERLYARAGDGVKIPISLVYKRGFTKDGTNRLILDGYGAYGSSRDPYFSSSRVSLLDRGFMYAIAHVRGGGEMGRMWYEQGKLLNKKNTFNDFIACAEYLIKEKYTTPQNLVIAGGSAGGLLIGAVLNMRPELFKAAIADVPFVDALNTMLDPSIPLTIQEYEEWGNPHQRFYYDYIKSYSPYDNIRTQNYPDLLITASLYDQRVGFWEPAKLTAKLRAMKTDDNLLLLKTNMTAGHGGASGRYEFLKEIAFEYAFILSRFGIDE